MTVAFDAPGITLHHGDCIDVMRTLPDASVDAVVTDPPYGLEFMGKAWDSFGGERNAGARGGTGDKGILPGYGRGGLNVDVARFKAKSARAFGEWCELWAVEALRVLKPGGHLLVFGGSRTWHRLAVAIEDAGFEIRDSIAWIYGSGFPKSMNVAKAIASGSGRPEDIRRLNMGEAYEPSGRGRVNYDNGGGSKMGGSVVDVDLPEEAQAWEGWGTALKPAFEPIIVARKPLTGTVAANVLAYGTGALNIDATRTAFASEADRAESVNKNQHAKFGTEPGQNNVYGDYSTTEVKDYDGSKGRWPTNVLLDESQAAELDRQSGVSQSRIGKPRSGPNGDGWGMTATGAEYNDAGGASRFFPTFRYEAKAGSDERPNVDGVQHPTVKPLDLMRWLVRLVTPPDGIILEPFAGSGTTLEAALIEGFTVIGIEREADYLPLIEARITKPLQPVMFGDIEEAS